MAVPTNTGYPLKWFKDEDSVRDKYECSVCQEVIRDAVQVPDCGHQFCRFCLSEAIKRDNKCPSCRRPTTSDVIFDDQGLNRIIRKLDVRCPNRECTWEGNINPFIEEHYEICPLRMVSCSFDGCYKTLLQKNLKMHENECKHRIVSCKYCNKAHAFNNTSVHRETCTHLPVECINKCSLEKVPRNKMEAHIQTTCPKTVIKCMYSESGCEHKCERHQMEDHLEKSMKSHLDLSNLEICRLRRVNATISAIPPLMVITDFNRKLSEAKEENKLGIIEGDPFYTSPHGYKLKMRVDLNEIREEYKGHMAVFICVMKSDHDAILSWPFKKKYTFTLIDQQDNEEERKNIVKTTIPKGQNNFNRPIQKENYGFGAAKFVSHATLQTRKYIKDDTVFITVSIEP